MTVLPVLGVGFFLNLLAVLFVVCAIALILIILIQKGKGGGLSGALGGGMASNILGTKTGDFLTWFTIGLAGMFLFLLVVLARLYKPTSHDFGTTTPPATQSAPAGTEQNPTPAPSQIPAAPVEQNNAPAETNAVKG